MADRICSVEGCPNKHAAKGWCHKHYKAVARYGDPHARGVRPQGPAWYKWKDVPSYQAVHMRLYKERGKAKTHACVDCGQQAHQWSYDHTSEVEHWFTNHAGIDIPYTTDLTCYSPRCLPCHRNFDLGRCE